METKQAMRSTYFFLKALAEPEGGRPYETTIDNLGRVQLYVYVDRRAGNRVAYMRKPRILVKDSGNATLSGYCAVFVCENDAGNRYLAAMEDPAHLRWHQEEAKHWTKQEREVGKKTLKKIKDWISDTLGDLSARSQKAEQDIAGLADFLPDDDEPDSDDKASGGGPETREGQQQPETGLEVPQEVPPVEVQPNPPGATTGHLIDLEREGSEGGTGGDTGGGRGESGGGGSGGDGDGPNPGSTGDGPGTGSGTNIGDGEGEHDGTTPPGRSDVLSSAEVSFRSFARSSREYRVIVRAKRACSGGLRLRAIGEESNYAIRVLSVRAPGAELSAEGPVIRGISLSPAQALHMDIEIDSDVRLSLGAAE